MPTTKLIEKLICQIKKWPIYCPICNRLTLITDINPENLRESCICQTCHSTNRQRQITYSLCQYLNIRSLKQLGNIPDITIYNTESSGPLHQKLKTNKNYICSEYFGSKHKSGTMVKGILNQDLTNLSFKNNSVDIVLSSDVFEHIPKPYQAHREVYRVLKKHGCHIFTVPFCQNQLTDETRATIDRNSQIVYIKKPIYHLDGIRPDKGALVYNIFGKEMLSKLKKLGFKTKTDLLSKPFLGILGNNAIVFTARKV